MKQTFTSGFKPFAISAMMSLLPNLAMAQSRLEVQPDDVFAGSNLQIITDATGTQIGLLSKEHCFADARGEVKQLVYLTDAEGRVDFSVAYSVDANKKYVFDAKGHAVTEEVKGPFEGVYFDASGHLLYSAVDGAQNVQLSDYRLEDRRISGSPEYYALVKIGNQVWMRENLRATAYTDGTPIPGDFNKDDWKSLTSGAYAVYVDEKEPEFNKEATLKKMGALYNWYAVTSGKGLAPQGYQVPGVEDYITLVSALNPGQFNSDWEESFSLSFTLGESLKSKAGWSVPPSPSESSVLQPGNNLSGLNIEPFGSTSVSRYFNGFSGKHYQAYLWTKDSFVNAEDKAMFLRFYWDSQTVNVFYEDKFMGYSIRCFANNPEIILKKVQTGIGSVDSDSSGVHEVLRYDITGSVLKAPVQGINIVKYSDGSTRKVFVK